MNQENPFDVLLRDMGFEFQAICASDDLPEQKLVQIENLIQALDELLRPLCKVFQVICASDDLPEQKLVKTENLIQALFELDSIHIRTFGESA